MIFNKNGGIVILKRNFIDIITFFFLFLIFWFMPPFCYIRIYLGLSSLYFLFLFPVMVGFVTMIYINFDRSCISNENAYLSPVDGIVITKPSQYTINGKIYMRISIRQQWWDYRGIYAPIAGMLDNQSNMKVVLPDWAKNLFGDNLSPDSSNDFRIRISNDVNECLIEGNYNTAGYPFLSAFALISKGEIIGSSHFSTGATFDVYVPIECDASVAKGQIVIAGETMIAEAKTYENNILNVNQAKAK